MNDDHHHCKVCGRVCAADAEVCSSGCRAKLARRVESRRNSTYVLYGLIAVLIVLLLANTFGI